jgi:DNA-binding transcriptional LysR family regulator
MELVVLRMVLIGALCACSPSTSSTTSPRSSSTAASRRPPGQSVSPSRACPATLLPSNADWAYGSSIDRLGGSSLPSWAEADAALEAVEFARAEPRGLIKLSCPVALAQTVLAQLLPDFFARYPNIRLLIFATNRRVDVLNEGLDVAVRVRTQPSGEDGLVMRTFGESSERLVSSPAYLERAGVPQHPRDLVAHQTLGFAPENERQTWELRSVHGETTRVDLSPRLVCHDFIVLKAAVLAGLGIAFLPHNVVSAELEAGTLRPTLPEWSLPTGIVHAVFPTRRGLLPSVRALIDFLAARLPTLL